MSTINDNLLNGQTVNDWLLNGGSGGGSGGGLTTAEVQALIDAAGHLSSTDAQALIDATDHLNAVEVQALIDASGGGGYCPKASVSSPTVAQGVSATIQYSLTGAALDSIASATLVPVGIGGIATASIVGSSTFNSMILNVATDASEGVYDLHLLSSCGGPVLVVSNWIAVQSVIVPGSAATPWTEIQFGVTVGLGTIEASSGNAGAMFSAVTLDEDFRLSWNVTNSGARARFGVAASAVWGTGSTSGHIWSVENNGTTSVRMFKGSSLLATEAKLATDNIVVKREGDTVTVHLNDVANPPIISRTDVAFGAAGFFKATLISTQDPVIDIALSKG